MTTVVCLVIALGCAIVAGTVTLVAQKIADWWYDYSMRRALDKIIEKELRQSRREFRR